MREAENLHADVAQHAEYKRVHELAGDEVREGLGRHVGDRDKAAGGTLGQEIRDDPPGKGADLLLFGKDVDRDDQTEEPVHQRADDGGAHIGGGADDVAHAVGQAGEKLLDGRGPVDAEVEKVPGFEIEAREQALDPGNELLDVGRQALCYHGDRVYQPGQQHGEEYHHHAERYEQRADYGERAAEPAHKRAAVLRHAVKQPVFKQLERHVQHEGEGEAGDDHVEHVPNRPHRAVERAEVLRGGVQRDGKGYYEQDRPDGPPV